MAAQQLLIRFANDSKIISFAFSFLEKQVKFDRKKSEPLAVALRRFGLACDKAKNLSKAKIKQVDVQPETVVSLIGPDGELDKNEELLEAVQKATSMCIGNEKYEILINPPIIPTLLSVHMPDKVLATCPIHLYIKSSGPVIRNGLIIEWKVAGSKEVISQEFLYSPPKELAGKELDLTLSYEDGDGVSARTRVLGWNPQDTFADERLEKFQKQAENLRVMSFNILAQMYLRNTDYTDTVYPYCTANELALDYRMSLIGREILAIRPDIVCLQEVQNNVFQEHLSNILPADEYFVAMRLKQKGGGADGQEGCAMALRKTRFEIIQRHDISLSEEILQSGVPGAEDWQSKPWAEKLKKVLQNVASIAQICVVKELPSNKQLVICNTHMFYHPDAPHIRLLQIAKIVEELTRIVKETGAIPFIIGDFNMLPETAAWRFLVEKEVSADDPVWRHCEIYEWKRKDEVVPVIGDMVEGDGEETESDSKRAKKMNDGFKITHDLDLTHCFPDLEWTNVDNCFQGFLDHIFVGSGIEVVQSLEVPRLSSIREKYVGLPNRCYGSDHIAVATDVRVIENIEMAEI